MKTLQLYIHKSLRGFRNVRNFNAEAGVLKQIAEQCSALAILEYDPAEKYIFYLLSYVREGVFLTILRTIPDKRLDHLATTIFVPGGLQITATDLLDVVRRTARIISNQSVSTEDIAELQRLFKKEYPCNYVAAPNEPSAGSEYAIRYYGSESGRSLSDFLGDKLYRQKYAQYAGVLLVDEELGVKSSAEQIKELQSAEETIIEMQPEELQPEVDNNVADGEEYEESDGESRPVRYTPWWMWVVLPLLGFALGLLAGWLLFDSDKTGVQSPELSEVIQPTPDPAPAIQLPKPEPEPIVKPDSTPSQPELAPEVDTIAAPTVPIITSAEAIAYLDSNKVWTRSGLDKFPELRGLFDDLNNYSYQRILKVWKPLLDESKNFAIVARAVDEGSRKKRFVPQAGNTYCGVDGKSINWRHYTYRTDP